MVAVKLDRNLAFVVVVSGALGACGVFETPFSLNVNRADELQPQEPAAIQLSPPQIYARETLVNERREEAAFIREELERSKNRDEVKFEPEIARNLRTITEMRNALAVHFDPAGGNIFAREDAIAAAQAERDLIDAQIELETARRQLEALRAQDDENEIDDGDEDGDEEEAEDGDDTGDPGDGSSPSDRIDSAKLKEQVSALELKVANQEAEIKRLESLAATLKTQVDTDKDFKEATPSAIGSSPLEEFLDRSHYRSVLNSALAEVSLDDLHDYDGNSLYRLQFRATVLPGKVKDKWGIARLTLVPPQLTNDEIRQLYNAWLSHITYRINRVVPGTSDRLEVDEQYIMLASSGIRIDDNLFDITRIYFDPSKQTSADDDCFIIPKSENLTNCQFISIAVPPGTKGILSGALKTDKTKQLENKITELRNNIATSIETYCRIESDLAQLAFKLLKHGVSITASVQGLGDRNILPTKLRRRASLLLDELEQAIDDAQTFVRQCESKAEISQQQPLNEQLQSLKEQSAVVPKRFKEILVRDTARREHCRVVGIKATIGQLRSRAKSAIHSENAAFLLDDYDLELEALTGGWSNPVRANDFTNLQMVEGLNVIEDLLSRSRSVRVTLQRLCSSPTIESWQDFHDSLQSVRSGYDHLGNLEGETSAAALWLATEVDRQFSTKPLARSSSGVGLAMDRFGANGQPYAYAAGPLEHVQRLSTVAGASNTVQLAVALSAVFAAEGVSAEDAFEFTRIAVGNVSAQERVPLVVGYSDRSDPIDAAEFGWLFGPPARVNAEENSLDLVQGVRNYPVFADVSVPGWWPRLSYRLETAWVENWHNTSDPIKLGGNKRYFSTREVRLPANRADLDGLTNLIANAVTGPIQRFARISHVEPRQVSACADKISFHIYGANVWRSSKITFGGMSILEDDIEVLPDMEGLRVNVALKDLPRRPPIRQPLQLVVSTRNGTDDYPIAVVGSRKDGRECGLEATGDLDLVFDHRPNEGPPLIRSIAPTRISACASAATFVLTGTNLSPNLYPNETLAAGELTALLGEKKFDGTAMKVLAGNRSNGGTMVLLSADNLTELDLKKRGSTIPLVYVTKKGVATAEVSVDKTCATGVSTQQPGGPFSFSPQTAHHFFHIDDSVLNPGTGHLRLLLTGAKIPDTPHSFSLLARPVPGKRKNVQYKNIVDLAGINFDKEMNNKRTGTLKSRKIDLVKLDSSIGNGSPVEFIVRFKEKVDSKEQEIKAENPLFVYKNLRQTAIAAKIYDDDGKAELSQPIDLDLQGGAVPAKALPLVVRLRYPVNLHKAVRRPDGKLIDPAKNSLSLTATTTIPGADANAIEAGIKISDPNCVSPKVLDKEVGLEQWACDYTLSITDGSPINGPGQVTLAIKLKNDGDLPNIAGAFAPKGGTVTFVVK